MTHCWMPNRQLDAMIGLYSLQQSYLTEDFDNCRNILQSMEDQGLPGAASR